jgi:hypothetical protein
VSWNFPRDFVRHAKKSAAHAKFFPRDARAPEREIAHFESRIKYLGLFRLLKNYFPNLLDTVTVAPYILANSGIAPRQKASRKTRGAFGVFGPPIPANNSKKEK